jgi:hypothetical protein
MLADVTNSTLCRLRTLLKIDVARNGNLLEASMIICLINLPFVIGIRLSILNL